MTDNIVPPSLIGMTAGFRTFVPHLPLVALLAVGTIAFSFSTHELSAAKRKKVVVRTNTGGGGSLLPGNGRRIKLRSGQSRNFTVDPDNSYAGNLYVQEGIPKPKSPRKKISQLKKKVAKADGKRRKKLAQRSRKKGAILTRKYRKRLKKYRRLRRENSLDLAVSGLIDQTYSYRLSRVRANSRIEADFVKSSILSNPGDPSLMKTKVEGGTLEYIGSRDGNGNPDNASQVNVETDQGDVIQYFIDDTEGLNRIVLPDGTVATFVHVSGTTYRVSFLSDDGETEEVVIVDTDDFSSQQAFASGLSAPSGEPSFAPMVAPASLDVTRCQQPIEGDPTVFVTAATVGGSTEQFPATRIGAGLYEANLPTLPGPTEYDEADLDDICDSAQEIVDNTCTVFDFFYRSGLLQLACATTLNPVTFAGCVKATTWIEVVCFSPEGGGPSAAGIATQGLCQGLEFIYNATGDVSEYLEDRVFEEERLLTGFATLDGESVVDGPVSWLPGDPTPSFSLEFPEEASFSTFTTNPPDPAPSEGYDATVNVFCAPPGTVVEMSISGTDGFTSSTDCTVSGDSDCTLYVPGAAAGVLDTVTVTLPNGKKRSLTVVF